MTASRGEVGTRQLPLLQRRVAALETERIALEQRLDEVERSRSELPLANLVDSVGLAVALGEATMQQHAISSVSVSARIYIVPTVDGVGFRFQPPEQADHAVGLSTATFELAKVPGQGPAVPSLYAVLDEKQRLYTTGPLASQKDARRLVAELHRTLAAADAWTIEFLVEQAEVIARLERRLAGAGTSGEAAHAAADELSKLAERLEHRRPVAGDVYALAAAFRATTAALAALGAAQATERARSSRSKPAP